MDYTQFTYDAGGEGLTGQLSGGIVAGFFLGPLTTTAKAICSPTSCSQDGGLYSSKRETAAYTISAELNCAHQAGGS